MGQYVTIAGASPAGYNGTFIITTTAATTFTYTVSSGLTSPATGTISYSMAPIQVWENSVFLVHQSSIAGTSLPGSWYWDGTNLYVNGWNQDNPVTNGRMYEVAHLKYGIFDNSNSYLQIENIDSKQTYGSADANGNYTSSGMGGIYLQGSNNIVHDLSVYNTARHGFSFYVGSTNNLAYNLTIHDDVNTTPATFYGAGTTNNTLENSSIYNAQAACVNDGLLIFHGTASNNVVQNNDFNVEVGNPPQVVNTYDAGTNGNIIRFNHIHGSFQYGIYGTAVSNDVIYGNVVEAQNGSLPAIYFNTGSGVSILNNTILSPASRYAVSLVSHSGGTVKNNIFYGPQTLSIDATSTPGFTSDYNLFYNSGSVSWQWGSNSYSSLANWRSNSSQDSHSVNSDPVFTNASSIFTLTSSSPAIDSAVNLGTTYQFALDPATTWPSNVLLDNQNSNGTGWEMGAYVYPNLDVPTVTITSPTASSTVFGTTTITAMATSTAQSGTISSVQFLLDGVNLGSAVTSSPWQISWNTTSVSNGSHTLSALATDNYNSTSTSAGVTVSVQNAAPAVSSFLASPSIVALNGTTTLSWTVASATSISISPAIGTVTGSTTTTPSLSTTTLYTLTAVNSNGTSTATTTVSIAQTTYTIGGSISGLSGTVTLQDNGGDNFSTSTNGSFTFATLLSSSAPYSVTVLTQPSGQTCNVTNGSGTMGSANVTNVSVSCTTNSSGGGGGGGGGGALYPSISQVTVSSTTPTSVIISWATNYNTTAEVDYGTSTSYNLVQTSSIQTTTPIITLTNLTPATTYQFIVKSNLNGEVTVSSNSFFTTLSSNGQVFLPNPTSISTPPGQTSPGLTVPTSDSNTPTLRLVNDSGTFFLISKGQRQGITDPGILFSYGLSFSDALMPAAADLSLPAGPNLLPADGALVKTIQDPTVYLISGQQRHAFTSASVFLGLDFKWSNILVVTSPELGQQPIGTIISSFSLQHLPGLDINENGTIYWIGNDGELHPYPDLATYNSWHTSSDFSKVVAANSADKKLPIGAVVGSRILN